MPRLLQAVDEQTVERDQWEVVVVDSGSEDNTLAIAESHGAKIVHIPREQFSFGHSLNLGCEAAQGDVLVAISGHCVPTNPYWLARLIRPFEDPSVGVTYGRQVGGPETKFSETRIFDKYFPNAPTPSQNTFYFNNANSAVRRTVWEKYRFDEQLTGLEDMQLGKRAVADGWNIQYVHNAVVYHYHHESWGQVKRRFEREALALREIMPELHLKVSDVGRYWTAALLSDYSHALRQRCLWGNFHSIALYRFCQFYGSWRGNHIHRRLSHKEKERYFYPR